MKNIKAMISKFGNNKIYLLALLFSITTLFSGELTGLQIIKNVYNRDVGKDMTATLTMSLINSHGNIRKRVIKQFSKEYASMDKKIMFFTKPADVSGTSFMNWSYDAAGKGDDQWIYLPALKKIKRISSDSKGDYFMGSDFTYDDLGDRKPGDDKHKLTGEEVINGEACYVIESTPLDPDYMYSKTITWISKDKWIGMKKLFFDEDGDELKTLTIKKFEKISGFWIIVNTEMNNIQDEHKTQMILENIKINSGIVDEKFTDRMMKRGVK